MIGNSRLHTMLRNGRLLSDVVAWYTVMDNKEMKNFIVKTLTRDQWFDKGLDSDGNVIGYYSYMTEIISGGKKQQGDHYTLLDTGDLVESVYSMIFANEVVIMADTAKIESQDWFTDKILGLTDENITKVKEKALPKFREYLRSVLFRTI